MKYKFLTLIIQAMILTKSAPAQKLDFTKLKNYEHQLDDIMELTDTAEIKAKLKETEAVAQNEPTELNKVRLGIIYHETALNLSFLSKTGYKGYAKKSFDVLTELSDLPSTTKELMPFITSYQASALSLVGAEMRKLKLVGQAFALFKDAIDKYAMVSYLPEFLRGSVAENLPWFFISKRKFAKLDFESIINKQKINSQYANWKVMSFTYLAWAAQHQSKKFRTKSIEYLNYAIALDINDRAGQAKAEKLKLKLEK